MKKILLLGLFLSAFSIYGEAIVNIEDQRNEGKMHFPVGVSSSTPCCTEGGVHVPSQAQARNGGKTRKN